MLTPDELAVLRVLNLNDEHCYSCELCGNVAVPSDDDVCIFCGHDNYQPEGYGMGSQDPADWITWE